MEERRKQTLSVWKRIKKQNHWIYGLMAGITIGFAVWGSVEVRPCLRPECLSAAAGQSGYSSAALPEAVPEELKQLHAGSAVLMDADSGRILFGKNEDEVRPMASTTKIMTCILALEQADPETVCTVSSAAAAQPKVHLGAGKGSEFFLRDLLYSLMLESHNDSAVMIAEAVAGSTEAFSDRMDQKAAELGCSSTCFVTPNGLDGVKRMPDGRERIHATTAADLARIMRYCIRLSPKREEFLKITRTMDYGFSDLNRKQFFSCRNHNALLSMLPGMLSGKTGFTGGAGYSYVGAYENEGRTYIIALLGCGWPPHKTWKWEDAKKLFSYGKTYFRYQDIFQKQPDRKIPVEQGVSGQVLCRAQSSRKGQTEYRLLLSDADRIELRREEPPCMQAPVQKGEQAGRLDYYLNGDLIYTDPFVTVEAVAKRTYGYCLRQLLQIFLL